MEGRKVNKQLVSDLGHTRCKSPTLYHSQIPSRAHDIVYSPIGSAINIWVLDPFHGCKLKGFPRSGFQGCTWEKGSSSELGKSYWFRSLGLNTEGPEWGGADTAGILGFFSYFLFVRTTSVFSGWETHTDTPGSEMPSHSVYTAPAPLPLPSRPAEPRLMETSEWKP